MRSGTASCPVCTPDSATATGCTAAGTPGPAPAGIRPNCCSTRTPGPWTATSAPERSRWAPGAHCPPSSTGMSATGPNSGSPTPCATTAIRRRTSPKGWWSAAPGPTGARTTTHGATTAGPRPHGRIPSSTSCMCAVSPCGTRGSRSGCAVRMRDWPTPLPWTISSGSGSPRSSCCRSISSPTRTISSAGGCATTGATTPSAISRHTPVTPPPAPAASRSVSSSGWCGRCTTPASRSSWTSSTTTPPRRANGARP